VSSLNRGEAAASFSSSARGPLPSGPCRLDPRIALESAGTRPLPSGPCHLDPVALESARVWGHRSLPARATPAPRPMVRSSLVHLFSSKPGSRSIPACGARLVTACAAVVTRLLPPPRHPPSPRASHSSAPRPSLWGIEKGRPRLVPRRNRTAAKTQVARSCAGLQLQCAAASMWSLPSWPPESTRIRTCLAPPISSSCTHEPSTSVHMFSSKPWQSLHTACE
jgi:hypothetical protein